MEKSPTNVFTVRKHLQTRATLKIIWEFTLARNLLVVHSVQYRFLPQVNWKYIQLFTQVRNLTNVSIVRSHLDIKGTWRSIWVRVHHVRVHPQRRKLYSCSQCERSRPGSLKSRIKDAHGMIILSGEKPYKYSLCKRVISFKPSLHYHRRIWHWDKTHSFLECKKTFSSPLIL